MGLRSVTAAVCVCLLSVGTAIYCYLRSEALQSEGRWLMERGSAQAAEYAQRLDDSVAAEQLKTFATRRTVMERAHQWQRGQMVSVLVAVLAALSAYVLWLLRRLDEQLADASHDLHASKSPGPPESSPALVPSPHR